MQYDQVNGRIGKILAELTRVLGAELSSWEAGVCLH